MGNFFVLIYEVLSKFKRLVIFLLFFIFLGSLYLISSLKQEEDIAKMMPTDNKVERLNEVFNSSKFLDKLIVSISFKDSSLYVENDLAEYAQMFCDSVNQKLYPNYISEQAGALPEDFFDEIYSKFYENLPFFLDAADYEILEENTKDSAIYSTLQKNYRNLISPAGLVSKKFILKDPLSITPLALKKLASIQLDDNYQLLDGWIFTKDKKNILLFLKPSFPSNETQNNAFLLEELNQIISKNVFDSENKVQIIYYGASAVAVGNASQIKQDIILTVSIAMVILLVFITLFFRRITSLLVIMMPVVFGAALSLAFISYTQGSISTIALAVGSVLLGITIDFSLHTLTHFRSVGNTKKVIIDIATPVVVSALTTSSAFLCLYFVRSEALNELGLFAAISVFSAAMFCLIVFPLLINPKKWHVQENDNRLKFNFLDKISHVSFDKNKSLIFLVLGITVLMLFFYAKVEVEQDMMKMNYMSDELTVAENEINKVNNYALKSVYLISTGKTLNQALIGTENVKNQLRKLKEEGIINNYSTPTDLLLSDAIQKQKIAQWETFWSPERKDLVKTAINKYGDELKFKTTAFQSFFDLLDHSFETYPVDNLNELQQLYLSDLVSVDDSAARVITQIKVNAENKHLIYAAFENNQDVVVLDKQYITEKFLSILKEDFGKLVSLSLLAVFVILLLAYGRIEMVIITMIPMAISWLWTLGIMGMFDIKFNIFNIIISTFIFGLGVDYSVFISRGLIQDYAKGEKNLSSYKKSILLSAFTTLIGIGVLIFAKHPSLQSIALMSIIGIINVVIISFTIQPLIFNWMFTSRKEKGNVPMTFFNFINSLTIFLIFIVGALFMTIVGVIFLIPPYKNQEKRKLFYHYLLMYICKLVIYIPINVKKRIIRINEEDFSKPCVIIANHQSHIDIPLILMLHPKIIVLVNDWVWNNPYYGVVVKLADFYPVSSGFEGGLDKLKEKVKQGYSVLVFPEGSRQADCEIQRFHKGAFVLAQELHLDILPVIIHGAGHCMTKGDNHLKSGQISLKILPRILASDLSYGQVARKRAKEIGDYFKNEFDTLKSELETTDYFRGNLLKNYLFKGPTNYWYVFIKTALENNYSYFNQIIPKEASIVDIGCGMGYFSYMMFFTSSKRTILGIDYDESKIAIANNCPSKRPQVNFLAGNALEMNLPNADVFTLLDILHYLPKEQQISLLIKAIKSLNPNGVIIVRDADASMKNKTFGTKMTEWFSTKFFQFNKTEHDLTFISRDIIIQTVEQENMQVEIIDETKITSNIIYLIRHI
jgi:uncharacterized protein